MKLNAEWTDDCQGKKDYDGDILSISTRYWPQGGGYSTFTVGPEGGTWKENEDRPKLKPSANSSLILRGGAGDDDITLCEADFEGETFEEIAKKVEVWAQEKMDKAVNILRAAFAV